MRAVKNPRRETADRSIVTDEKIPYLYIAGASFSGSTLLAFLLNAHPQMTSLSEVWGVLKHERIEPIENYRCSCGERLIDCGFYRALERRVRQLGSTFDIEEWQTRFQLFNSFYAQLAATRPLPYAALHRARSSLVSMLPGVEARRQEIAKRNVDFARATLELSGSRLFVDAQKDAARIGFLAQIEQLDLHVIHLVRDARAGAASYMKHNPRNDAARAARRWRSANRTASYMARELAPERWLQLRYDELCLDPQGSVDRIAEFCGMERATLPQDFFGVEHHIVGNSMRLGGSTEIRPDESWRQRLSDQQVEQVRAVAGADNRAFGFDWPT